MPLNQLGVNSMEIRQAHQSDARQLVGLLQELGYEIAESDLQVQIKIYSNSAESKLLVAMEDEHISGLVAGHLIPLIHQAGSVGRITALVVEKAARGRGVGACLMDELESWFEQHNCLRLEVTSSDRREKAHRFYQSRGFMADDRRFIKCNVTDTK